jgi:fluoride ion exporter CrcB/FEX
MSISLFQNTFSCYQLSAIPSEYNTHTDFRQNFPETRMSYIPENIVYNLLGCTLVLQILSRVRGYAWWKWRVLVRMIGFISTLVTHSLFITFNTHLIQTIQRYRWFTYIPVHRCAHTRILSSPLVISLQQISAQKLALKSLQVLHLKSSNYTSYITVLSHT